MQNKWKSSEACVLFLEISWLRVYRLWCGIPQWQLGLKFPSGVKVIKKPRWSEISLLQSKDLCGFHCLKWSCYAGVSPTSRRESKPRRGLYFQLQVGRKSLGFLFAWLFVCCKNHESPICYKNTPLLPSHCQDFHKALFQQEANSCWQTPENHEKDKSRELVSELVCQWWVSAMLDVVSS